ncbi:hypothetical protein BDZ97DRAFT_1984464 [Flammula alnicola]|nr:hypothetical protein BDZ97DRAFT_1984464 [Flammula alnicola]
MADVGGRRQQRLWSMLGPLLDSKEQVAGGLVFIGEVVSNSGAGWASRRQKETSFLLLVSTGTIKSVMADVAAVNGHSVMADERIRRGVKTNSTISAKLEKRESYLLDSTRLTLILALYPAYLLSVARMNQMPAGSGVMSAFRGARKVGEKHRGGGMFGTAERSGLRKSMKTNTMHEYSFSTQSFAAIPQFVVTPTSLAAGFLEVRQVVHRPQWHGLLGTTKLTLHGDWQVHEFMRTKTEPTNQLHIVLVTSYGCR